jgi:C-terminal processing protease CtpA/Prc
MSVGHITMNPSTIRQTLEQEGKIMSAYVRCLLLALAFAAFTGTSCAQKSESTAKSKESGRAWLGVSLQDVTPRLAREEELPVKSGALVQDVAEGSPAEKAGVHEGDVIVSLNGKEIDDGEALVDAVGDLQPGSKADLVIVRKSGKTTLSLTLGKQASRTRSFSFSVPDVPPVPRIRIITHQDMLGMSLTALSKQLAEYFEIPKGRGVLVEEVEEDSPAAKAGLKAGDVIVSIDGSTTKDPDDVAEALGDASSTAKVPVDVIRKGKSMTMELDAARLHKEQHRKHRFLWKDEDMSWGKPERERFRSDMQRMKEDLRRMGRELSVSLHDLGRKIRMEISSQSE